MPLGSGFSSLDDLFLLVVASTTPVTCSLAGGQRNRPDGYGGAVADGPLPTLLLGEARALSICCMSNAYTDTDCTCSHPDSNANANSNTNTTPGSDTGLICRLPSLSALRRTLVIRRLLRTLMATASLGRPTLFIQTDRLIQTGSSTAYYTGSSDYHPIMLNRPFRNVAELGYGYFW